jgi:Zn-dependent protease
MVRFSLFGIPIEIQPWFWLTLALVGGINGASTPAGFLAMMLFILAGFISVLIHELGHALTGRRFGAATAITLHAFGGYASFPANRFTRGQDFLVTAAGPAFQIALGGLFLAFHAYGPEAPPMLAMFIRDMIWISIAWAVLNLIPVLPLDGGRLMASILGPRQFGLTLKISMIVGIVGAGLLFKFTGSFLFPIFLAMMAYQNWQEIQQRRRGGL